MDPVLQNGRRPRRPWTAQEQVTAEVAAACGVSLVEIGKLFQRDASVIRCHLAIAAAAARAKACQRYISENRNIHRERCRRYRESYPDRVRESQQRFHAANPSARKAYYRANHAKRIAAMRAYHHRNRERIRMRRLANIEKRRQQYKKWLQKNPNWRKNYDLANKERIKKRCRIWYQLNRAKAIDKARRYDARKRASRKAALTPACFADVGGRFAVFNNCCAYCGSKDRLEVDHVVALSRGGLDEPSNIIPACRSCNGSKNARPIESWYRRQPFFTEARWRKIQRHCPAAVAGQLPLALPA